MMAEIVMKNQMLAAVYHNPRDLRIQEHPIPAINHSEALIKVVSTGICGTDLRILNGKHHMYPPGTVRIPGHEVVGDIVQIGDEVKGWGIGQRVFIAPNIGCGHCKLCISGNNNLCSRFEALGITIDGSFAEYMRVPAPAIIQGNLIPVSKSIDPALVVLIEPFACVMRGQDVLKIQPDETVLIIGAGPIGCMHAILAKIRGARSVIVSEVNPRRLEQAKEVGIEKVVNSIEEDLGDVIKKETFGKGADVIIVATSTPMVQEAALELASIHARINFFGGLPKNHSTIRFKSNIVHYKELVVTGTTGCSTNDCRRASEILIHHHTELSKMVSARFSLYDVIEALNVVQEGNSLKVILEP
jgi:L-iditol 2-dehydrogenase